MSKVWIGGFSIVALQSALVLFSVWLTEVGVFYE